MYWADWSPLQHDCIPFHFVTAFWFRWYQYNTYSQQQNLIFFVNFFAKVICSVWEHDWESLISGNSRTFVQYLEETCFFLSPLMRIRKHVNLGDAVSHPATRVVSPQIKPTWEKGRAKIFIGKQGCNPHDIINLYIKPRFSPHSLTLKASRTLWGSPGHKTLSIAPHPTPQFLFLGKRFSTF